jgi:hypothetical protein
MQRASVARELGRDFSKVSGKPRHGERKLIEYVVRPSDAHGGLEDVLVVRSVLVDGGEQ